MEEPTQATEGPLPSPTTEPVATPAIPASPEAKYGSRLNKKVRVTEPRSITAVTHKVKARASPLLLDWKPTMSGQGFSVLLLLKSDICNRCATSASRTCQQRHIAARATPQMASTSGASAAAATESSSGRRRPGRRTLLLARSLTLRSSALTA